MTFISRNQFGFMPERSTMETIFCIRQIVEKKSKWYMVFIDLEVI